MERQGTGQRGLKHVRPCMSASTRWATIVLLSMGLGAMMVWGHPEEGGDSAYRHLTLDEVAQTGHEVHYEEVADAYGGPMSRALVISVKAHPEVVWVRPDLGVGMVANPLVFGVDAPPGAVRWRKVQRALRRG